MSVPCTPPGRTAAPPAHPSGRTARPRWACTLTARILHRVLSPAKIRVQWRRIRVPGGQWPLVAQSMSHLFPPFLPPNMRTPTWTPSTIRPLCTNTRGRLRAEWSPSSPRPLAFVTPLWAATRTAGGKNRAPCKRGRAGGSSPPPPPPPNPPPPNVTFRRAAGSLRGPGQSPVLPSASVGCALTAAGVSDGVGASLAEPSSWRTGGCAGCCPPPDRPPPPGSPKALLRHSPPV